MSIDPNLSRPPVDDPSFDRTPPNDLAAEQSVLGGMLLSQDAITDVLDIAASRDFYRPSHRIVFDAAMTLFGRGEPVDAVSVVNELRVTEKLHQVGGANYIHTLISSVPTAANAGHYGRIVAELAVQRRLVEAGTRITQTGYTPTDDVDGLVDRAQALIYDVTSRRSSGDVVALGDLLDVTLSEIEAAERHDGTLTGVPTGFSDLDELTNGLQPGQLWIVAARPSVGKSTIGLDWARAAAIRYAMTTVVFSLEMSRSEITTRLLSAEGRVRLQDLRTGRVSEHDWQRLARRTAEVADAPLFIDDSANLTMAEIRAKCRRLKQRNNLRLVVLDYLQLMSSTRRVENRQQEVSDLSRNLKLLAKELEVPVVAISQLNRASEQRADKRPQLSDLRESGALEQDADGVILLYRDDVVDPESARAGEADLIVAKHRNGPVGTITVAFQGHYSRFVDMAPV